MNKRLRYKQNFAEAHNNMGLALANIGRLQDAIEHYKQALRLKPTYAEARNNLGEAIGPDRSATPRQLNVTSKPWHLNPTSQRPNIIWVLLLLQTGRPQEAINYFEQSIKLKPDYFITHNNLGTALLRTGRPEEAIEHYKQALRINPDYIQAYLNLAGTYAKTNRPAEAVKYARKGLELAQSQEQSDIAKQFEEILNSYGK